ncbi:hypothetical protein BZG36_03535 [Bifiguratus adelaidae]|uniref:Alpha-acetolactate decarboxylase n=1 Tax=Bifiguratus adelaidae TaxID=1938954 RepID=A0A261XZA8_9FUNG|nr:hypothetical protein BZG36_03535 [Bifiguratus adelaidae]
MLTNELYQYSILNALMSGVSEGGIPASKLTKVGNQGLGTFVRMNGELVLLDDTVYQFKADGTVRRADPEDEIPFAMAVSLDPSFSVNQAIDSKDAVASIIADQLPHTANLFAAYRIDAHFKFLKVRSVAGQDYKGQSLSELGHKQTFYEFKDVQGTIVGFYTPASWQGISVAGHHLHFISNDRTKGGHVLAVEAAMAKISGAIMTNVHIELPMSQDFNDADLRSDDAAIRKMEG